MLKKIILTSLVLLVFSVTLSLNVKQSESTSIDLANVEALASENDTDKYYCCGNSGDCVIGTNVVIHGKFGDKPCPKN
ncbi:MAG: NVEALA domain-containing protein [Dysgonomonas sp.]